MSDNSTTNNKKDNNDIYKEELKYFVKNPKSIYRTIEEANAEKLFWKIYNFLVQTNNYHFKDAKCKKWSQYIIEAESKNKIIKKTIPKIIKTYIRIMKKIILILKI